MRCGKVHRLRNTVTTADFGDKGTGVADHKLSTPLDRTVNLDAFAAQHLWRDLKDHWERKRYIPAYIFGNVLASEKLIYINLQTLTMMFFSNISSPGVPLA